MSKTRALPILTPCHQCSFAPRATKPIEYGLRWMLTLSGITKRYGGLLALDGVSVEFAPGEIHAVIGENGAGKSTLMNVVGGFIAPDFGNGSLGESTRLPFGDPRLTRHLGIEMVHQHFMLVPEFTVAENLALSALTSLSGALDIESATSKHRALAAKLGWTLDFNARTGSLPVGTQQRVELLKSLAAGGSVIVLDEPTAVLSDEEVTELFRVLGELRDEGRAVVLVAHKLREVLAVADRITVLRNGRVVGSTPANDTTEHELQTWMTGEALSPTTSSSSNAGEICLEARGLHVSGDRGEPAIRGIDLTVRHGEVVGIGGVDGNGQVELAEAIVGIRSSRSTSLRRPEQIGYIPQDRHADALALTMSIKENFLIGRSAGPLLMPKAVTNDARSLIDKFNIKAQNINDSAGSLSGGNQQKIVISRVMERQPSLLVAVNPTRGLDFQATQFVHSAIGEAAQGGMAVLLISTDRDEIRHLATSALRIEGGRI